MSESQSHPHRIPRQHGLDALRAFAMLLGIALHGALAFGGIPWIVQDLRPDGSFLLIFTMIHGFRMQLFILLSGYFTMMLWRKRGMGSLLRQRVVRVLLPCLIGLVTFIPLLNWVSMKAGEKAREQDEARRNAVGKSEMVEAIRKDDRSAIGRLLEAGSDPNEKDPEFGTPMLTWAARYGDPQIIKQLLDKGAEVKASDRDGYTALHSAAFLGHFRAVEILVQNGADPQALGKQKDTPMDTTRADFKTTAFIANLIRVPLRSEEELQADREECRKFLSHYTKDKSDPVIQAGKGWFQGGLDNIRKSYGSFLSSEKLLIKWRKDAEPFHLILTPVFHHLWFLWFLCWLVFFFVIFVGMSKAIQKVFPVGKLSPGWIISSWKWVWIVPLTMIPQLLMGTFQPGFGPDTSAGLIPQPHVLLYYGIFFGFGALYYDCDDLNGKLGRFWALALPASILILFPLGLVTVGNVVVSGLVQVFYAWAMSFACIGLFNRLLTRENKTIRYLSDSAYWLYLAHLPLIVWLQALVRDWDMPAWPKFLIICTLCTILLLISYQYLVRYTFVGNLLNGPRKRPQGMEHPVQATAS
jgi:peptidoglycan/LPS O-acetylase OafA/YrhL